MARAVLSGGQLRAPLGLGGCFGGPARGKAATNFFTASFDLLWLRESLTGLQLFAFTPDQAMHSPSSAPVITITLPDPEPGSLNPLRVTAMAFAPNGDAWVGYGEPAAATITQGRMISKISASKLTTTGSITPDFSFRLPTSGVAASSSVNSMLVRPNGDLWVACGAHNTRSAGLYRYAAADIASAGLPSPVVVLAQPFPPVPTNPSGTNTFNDFFFDVSGNLWFTNATASTVNRLSAAQLLSTNLSITPDIILSAGQYNGCAPDVFGNLWCGYIGHLDMFAAADILVSGSPTPTRVLTVGSGPSGRLRFDGSGNLWSAASGTGVSAYSPANIGATGTPPASSVLTGGGAIAEPRILIFNPASF